MAREKYPVNQTRCIDDCICPHCGHKFDGQRAINGDMDCMIHVFCPECNKEMEVSISVEYMCTVVEG